MKGNLKKILSAILVTAMSVGMCVSASAAPVIGNVDNQSIPLSAAPGSQGYINVYGNNVIDNDRNVFTWTYDGTTAQKWQVKVVDGGRVIKSVLNTRYALNPDRRSGQNWNCTVYKYYGNETDAVVEVVGYLGNEASGYSIHLVNYPGMYLKSDGYTNNSNIHWVYNTQSLFGGQETKYVWNLRV